MLGGHRSRVGVDMLGQAQLAAAKELMSRPTATRKPEISARMTGTATDLYSMGPLAYRVAPAG